MKKNKWIIGILIVLCIAIASIVIVLKFKDARDYKISDGKYYIKNNEEFKDAYIEVKGDYIQFHNIDLNSVYLEKMKSNYEKSIAKGNTLELSDNEYDNGFELNSWLVDKAYKIDYSGAEERRYGTNIYYSILDNGFLWTHIYLHYDTLNKTLTAYNGDSNKLEFEKK